MRLSGQVQATLVSGEDNMSLAVGLGAATFANSYLQGNMQADAQAKQQEINNKILMDDAINQYHQLDAAERDINSDSTNQLISNQLSLLERREQAKLMAGASGTQGGSVTSVLQDLAREGGANQAAILDNRAKSLDEITRQAESIRYGARRNADTRVLSRPSAFSSISAGLNAYSAGKGASDALGEYKSSGGGIGSFWN